MKVILLNADTSILYKLADMGIKLQASKGKHIMVYSQKMGNAYNTYYEWRWRWINSCAYTNSVYVCEEEFINKLNKLT